jgi:predicted glutamine amidotransferase
MCKIFAMTNMDKVNVNQKFLEVVKGQVCKTSDKDGFGYALLGQDGSLGGERTLRPISFQPLSGGKGTRKIDDLPILAKSSKAFGVLNLKAPKSFIAHGRYSTNVISLPNTHPFTNGEVALIHNGVVHDVGGFAKEFLKSTCDSEILLRYWEMGGMEDIEANVSGYYAFAILDKRGQLHVARDSMATLYISWCRSVQSYIIATTKDIIFGVAKKMKWKVETPEELSPDIYAIFDGNDIVSHRSIEPLVTGYPTEMNEVVQRSLGKWSDEGWGREWEKEIEEREAARKGQTYVEKDPHMEDVPSYKEGSTFNKVESMDGVFSGDSEEGDRMHQLSEDVPTDEDYPTEDDGLDKDVVEFIRSNRRVMG